LETLKAQKKKKAQPMALEVNRCKGHASPIFE
jgi:hypothetical protein